MIYNSDWPAAMHHLYCVCMCACFVFVCVCVCEYRPACHPPCCRAAGGPGRQERWWTVTDSAAAVGSAARECTPTPGDRERDRGREREREREMIYFITSVFQMPLISWVFENWHFLRAAPALVLFLISSQEDKVIQGEERNGNDIYFISVYWFFICISMLCSCAFREEQCLFWHLYKLNIWFYNTNALHEQNDADIWFMNMLFQNQVHYSSVVKASTPRVSGSLSRCGNMAAGILVRFNTDDKKM